MSSRLVPLFLVCVAFVAAAFLVARGCSDQSDGTPVVAERAGVDPVRPDATPEFVSPDATGEERTDATTAATVGTRAPRPAEKPLPKVRTEPFRGRALDRIGNAIEGAEITITGWKRGELERSIALSQRNADGEPDAVTGHDGRFTYAGGRKLGRTVALSVSARGYLVETRRHDFEEPDEVDFGDVHLEPAVIVEGWVRDDRGLPVEGARVRRLDESDASGAIVDMLEGFGVKGVDGSVECDAEGHFELPHERPGKFVLIAEEAAHLTARFEGVTPPAPGVMSAIVLTMARGGSIEGRVLGYPGGRRGARIAASPLDSEGLEDPGEQVRSGLDEILDATLAPAGTYHCEIDDDGHFHLRGLPAGGTFELQVTEKKDFVRVIALSDAVEVASGDAGVVLHYDAGATVTARVVDGQTGEPINRASVTAQWPTGRARGWLTPNGRGKPKGTRDGSITLYELRPPTDPAELELDVGAEGYISRTVGGLTVGVRDRVDAGVIELRRAAQLTFRVVDAQTGDPIRRARVTLREEREAPEGELTDDAKEQLGLPTRPTSRSAERTGRDGRCVLDGLAVETAELTVRAAKYPSHRERGFLLATATEEYVVRLTRGSALEVTVADPTGTPIEGALVRIRRVAEEGEKPETQRGTTGTEGLARFDPLLPGAYEARADHAAHALAVQLQVLGALTEDAEWTSITVTAEEAAQLRLELPGLGTVGGGVTSNGEPLVNASVSLRSVDEDEELTVMLDVQDELGNGAGRPKDETGGDGRFQLVGVPQGDYVLRVRHPELAMPEEVELTVAAGFNEVEVRASTTAVTGRVLDDEGSPVADARIRAVDVEVEASRDGEQEVVQFLIGELGSGTKTDANGRYDLRGLRSNLRLRIEASAPGYVAARSDELLLSNDEVRADVDLELDRAGSVEVSLVGDLDEIPITMVRARFVDEEGRHPDRSEVIRGRVGVVDGLAPGRWEFVSTDLGESDEASGEPVTVAVAAGERGRVELSR
ncbi:MAG: hypothetical protein GY711_14455 [bacterium]|nr:hypothetical protein [bacterium]